jgi:hypothetical protein
MELRTSVMASGGGGHGDSCNWAGTAAKTADQTGWLSEAIFQRKPLLRILYSCNLSNFYRNGDIVPDAFDSEHTSYFT